MIKLKKPILLGALTLYASLLLPGAARAIDVPWPMAGANPARTSWVSSSMPDNIATQWVKPITPYVSQKIQVIGAEDKVFVSTSAGLYAFNATNGDDVWQYPTALPLGHSPTYMLESGVGYLYVGGLDKKIHKVRVSDGRAVWTSASAEGGYVSSPIVVDNRVYATNRDGAIYAFNTSDGSQAWQKFQTGNQINQSPAYSDGVLYFASNDGYGYAIDAANGSLKWKSDADPSTSQLDKFPSQGFYSWWPVVYGEDVIFTRTGFYTTNGAESSWLFGSAPNTSMFAGRTSFETQSGYWPVGEKIVDVSSNPYGNSLPDYFETQESGDTRAAHGPYRRNAFFVNRQTGKERQFDLDRDGKVDAAPISWIGDGGTHYPPVVSGLNNVLYFNSVVRARGTSFNAESIVGWKVGTPYLSITMDRYRSSDEPLGFAGAGDKLYYNHCCDREIAAVNISRPNTDGADVREWSYIDGGGLSYFTWPLSVRGLPNSESNYYYKEAVKYFWDPQPNLNPPCCAAVFWNENDKVGPSIYNGRLYVIMGNALVALGAGGAGTNAQRLNSSVINNSLPTLNPPITTTQVKSKLEQEVSEMVQAGHLKPSYMHSGNITGQSFAKKIDQNMSEYWHNPADTQLVLLRALPYLSSTLQSQVKTYLQSELASFNPATIANMGFGVGTARDPWPYPPLDSSVGFRIPQTPQTGVVGFEHWGFPPSNVYALWKYAQAGLGSPTTLLSQWGGRLRVPVSANSALLTDTYLTNYPLVANAYIAGYKGYVELAKLAGQSQTQYGPYEAEMNRLMALRVANLTTFPNSQNSAASSYRSYYASMITYYNFAYMTPELATYLRTNGRSSDPNKDILSILQKYQFIAPYWMQAHNAETQGESVIQPYQQTHSLFQAMARIKQASQGELINYLDTPIVPVGDLYYIDNLVAILEAPGSVTSTPTPSSSPVASPTVIRGDADGDGRVTESDYDIWDRNFDRSTSNREADGDFNADGRVNGLDYVIWLTNFNL